MRKVVSLAVIILSLSACAESEAKDEVKKALIDPESAEFMAVASKNDIVCGLVNSKNRMGGYVGYRNFIVENGFAEIENPPDAEFTKKFNDVCPRESVDASIKNFIYQNQ